MRIIEPVGDQLDRHEETGSQTCTVVSQQRWIV